VTPAAVDSLKERHPRAIVYVRGEALLGVEAQNHTAGVLVTNVEAGTAAATAGIIKGDVIASIDGHTLPDFDRLTARIAQHRAGETTEIEIIRGEERKKLNVTFGSWAGRQ
jgi:S1-C subfamily serine protease